MVVDGVVSEERLAELLALQGEYPDLDYKQKIDLDQKQDLIELAKDVGAMRVCGGYIVAGADNQGRLTGGMDAVDLRKFDSANLVPKLLKYISQPLEVHTGIVTRDGHKVVVICVPASERGCAFFSADGMYADDDGEEVVVFREGDVFWRDGTRSVRLSQEGLEEVIERRAAERLDEAREEWVQVQREIQRQERGVDAPQTPTDGEDVDEDEGEGGTPRPHGPSGSPNGGARGGAAARPGSPRRAARPRLGSVNFDLSTGELESAALDFIREGDTIALKHLINDGATRARVYIDHGDIAGGLDDLLDKLICLDATFLDYDQRGWFKEVLDLLVRIYGMPLKEGDVLRLGHATRISPEEIAPQVWLAVIERVFALGGLADPGRNWSAVRDLTIQLPEPIAAEGYDTNWLRHALTMASRARHFEVENQTVSLLSLARNDAARLGCLRSDGLGTGDDYLLTSIAQFDVLSNIVAIGAAKSVNAGRVYYSNFARFYQSRVQPIVDSLLVSQEMRDSLFPLSDEDLAIALDDIGRRAQQEGWRYDGFHGWGHTPVADFIADYLPEPQED